MHYQLDVDRFFDLGNGADLVADAILPAQFFTQIETGAARQGEKRLMLAVLADAVGILRKPAAGRARLVAETEVWVASSDTAWPYSFLNICEALCLDAGRLRGALLRRREPDPEALIDGRRVVRFPGRRRDSRFAGRAARLLRYA